MTTDKFFYRLLRDVIRSFHFCFNVGAMFKTRIISILSLIEFLITSITLILLISFLQ